MWAGVLAVRTGELAVGVGRSGAGPVEARGVGALRLGGGGGGGEVAGPRGTGEGGVGAGDA